MVLIKRACRAFLIAFGGKFQAVGCRHVGHSSVGTSPSESALSDTHASEEGHGISNCVGIWGSLVLLWLLMTNYQVNRSAPTRVPSMVS